MSDLKELYRRIATDLPFYGEQFLKIKGKEPGQLIPLKFKAHHHKLHAQIEKMRSDTGMVRVLCAKGRQMGITTYTAARFFQHTANNFGIGTYIMTHHSETTNAVFEMVSRFLENLPEPLRPEVSEDNAKRVNFSKLGGFYHVGTAGSRATGRGFTFQRFHGSEVALWDNAEEHISGVMQALPLMKNTEAILESTGHGTKSWFYAACRDAMAGKGPWQICFLPWFMNDEYQLDPKNFIPTDEEKEIAKIYGLTVAQLCWRRFKLEETKDPIKFTREYPSNFQDCFVEAGASNTLISPLDVMRARKAPRIEGRGARILGVDPAETGDRTAFALRQGRVCHWVKYYEKQTPEHIVGKVLRLWKDNQIDYVVVDSIGFGGGLIGALREAIGQDRVRGVKFSNSALDDENFDKRRAELGAAVRDWLRDEPVNLPDSDELQADLCALTYDFDGRGRLYIEQKETAKRERGVPSPDGFDALAYTFGIGHTLASTPASSTKPKTNWVV